jgi:hypothetical protein
MPNPARSYALPVSETSAGGGADGHRQYSLEILEYRRSQLPHHRRQTKQEQYRDQNRPYIQPILRPNFSVHQPIHHPVRNHPVRNNFR